MRILTIALLFASLPALANPDYAPEINAVRDRERTYVATAGAKVGALKRYDLAMETVQLRMAEVAQARQSAFPATPPSPKTQTEYLAALVRDKASVDGLRQKLDYATPAIAHALADAEKEIPRLPELASAFGKVRDQVVNTLATLRQNVEKRQASDAAALDRWVEVQGRAAALSQDERLKRISTDLAFSSALSDVRETFRGMENAIEAALIKGDRAQATKLLEAHAWTRSIAPAFFAPIATSPERLAQVRALLADAEAAEKRLVGLASPGSRVSSVRGFSTESLAEGDPLGEDRCEEKAPEEIPGNETADRCTPRELTLPDGRQAVFADSPDSNKEVRAYEAQGTPTMSIAEFELSGGQGFAGPDPAEAPAPREAKAKAPPKFLDVPKGDSLQKQAERELSQHVPASAAAAAAPAAPGELEKNTQDLAGMVERARGQARDSRQQQGLDELQGEVARYQRLQNYFNSRSADLGSSAGGRHAAVASSCGPSAQQFPGSPPAPEVDNGDGDSDPVAVAKDLALMGADMAISDVPLLGNAYNFGNLVSAIATGKSLFGAPAGNLDKMVFLAATVGPFVPKGPIRKLSAKLAGQLERLIQEKKLTKVLDEAEFEIWQRLKRDSQEIWYRIDKKVQDQLDERLWDLDQLDDLLESPERIAPAKDTRRMLFTNIQRDEPATAFIRADDEWVVVNDRTGDIVQIKDQRKSDWKKPWRPEDEIPVRK